MQVKFFQVDQDANEFIKSVNLVGSEVVATPEGVFVFYEESRRELSSALVEKYI